MSYDYSLSFHEGDNFSIEHDNRERISPNVNREKIAENIVYEGNIPLQKFYEETFQKAYEEHIQRQIKNGHGNRVKNWPEKYYDFIREKQIEQEKIKKQMQLEKKHFKDIHEEDKYQRIAKQLIVQIGNIDDFENLSPEKQQELRTKMKEILKEYMETFQQENPNFRIVNAVIHCDELSLSPHLHLTYVAVSETKKGQRIQNSLNGALKAMGFYTDKKKDDEGVWLTAQMKWQKKERERIVGIAKSRGLNIGFESGKRVQTRTLQDYQRDRQKERDRALSAREENLAQQSEKLIEQQEKLEQRETIVQKKEEKIENEKIKLNARIHNANEQIADQQKEITKKEESLQKREEILTAEAEKSIRELQSAVSSAISTLKPPPGKRVDEYKTSMRSGCRIVPEKDLETLIDATWFRPDYIKQKMQKVVDKFNDLPFVQTARQRIFQLEHQIMELKRKIESLTRKNKEQQAMLDKAKEISLGNGKTMYDLLANEVLKEQQPPEKTHDYGDDILGNR